MGSLKIGTHISMQLTVTGHKSKKALRKTFLGCFLRGSSGRAGSEVLLAACVMCLPCLSGLCIKLLCSNSPTAMSGNSAGPQKIPSQHLFPPSLPVWEENCGMGVSAAACRSGSAPVLRSYLLWKSRELPGTATTRN